jgi:hypothetical protein
MTLLSGSIAGARVPVYRVLGGHLECRGELDRSSPMTTGSFVNVASIPSALSAGLGTTSARQIIGLFGSAGTSLGHVSLAPSGIISVVPPIANLTIAYFDGIRIPLS